MELQTTVTSTLSALGGQALPPASETRRTRASVIPSRHCPLPGAHLQRRFLRRFEARSRDVTTPGPAGAWPRVCREEAVVGAASIYRWPGRHLHDPWATAASPSCHGGRARQTHRRDRGTVRAQWLHAAAIRTRPRFREVSYQRV